MIESDLKQLFEKYLTEELSEQDFQRLWATLQQSDNREIWMSMINDVLENAAYQSLSDETMRNRVLEKLQPVLMGDPVSTEVPVQQKSLLRLLINRKTWWAAAVLICLLSAGAYLYLNQSSKEFITGNSDNNPHLKSDVAPGGNRALLTLADGTTIVLDSVANGPLSQQGEARVIKQAKGQLAYNISGSGTAGVVYNTLSTPRGGQFQVILPDGSKVWLNSISSLKYPTVFNGKERIVELRGQGYFEIAKNPGRPFKVRVGEMEVQVLGTHFDIMAYTDEPTINTTLLEGSVKVVNRQSTILAPGQQASVSNQSGKSSPILVQPVDVEKVVAWKNGLFEFNNADLVTILREIARWYDVEIVYETKTNTARYVGGISRNLDLSNVLRLLEANGIHHFRNEGHKVIVLP